MVLINGRKFACEACIRGHRASSCSHTGRRLQQVRPKGRPSSQCETCKEKRARGSFHGKCVCSNGGGGAMAMANGPESSGTSSSSPELEAGGANGSIWAGSMVGEDAWIAGEIGKGKHSLEALMNPCRCKTTGICTCCKTDSVHKDDTGQAEQAEGAPPGPCCDGETCCSEKLASPSCPTLGLAVASGGGGCCSSDGKRQAANRANEQGSHASLPSGMTREEMEAIVSPPCHCGPNCSCPGCLRESEASREERAKATANEECPDKCLSCSACAFGLTRPSGIEAVDEWMEKDKGARAEATVEQRPGPAVERPRKRAKATPVPLGRPPPSSRIPPPPLPPFSTAANFFASHFVNQERRDFFAAQLKAVQSGAIAKVEQEEEEGERQGQESAAYGSRLKGESDEDWQIRHGFYYLTPEAIRIFDSARTFKEERQRQEEQEERMASTIHADSPASSRSPLTMDELSELRRRALSARKTKSKG